MNSTEARFVLSAYRGEITDQTDPQLQEALAMTATDPVLRKWFERQRGFDAMISTALKDQLPPANLRSQIAAGVSMEKLQRRSRYWWFTAGIAAMFFLCLGVVKWGLPVDTKIASTYTTAMMRNFQSDWSFDHQSSSHGDIQEWLKISGFSFKPVPGILANTPPLGCKVFYWNGKPVRMICFQDKNGKEFHLFTMEATRDLLAATSSKVAYGNESGMNTALWRQGNQVYLIFTDEDKDRLQEILQQV